MRSRSRSQSSEPCSCGGTCDCHKPFKEKIFPLLIPIAFPIVIPLLFPILFLVVIFSIKDSDPVQHIQVNGQDCIVKHVNDHCTSTGACFGHDEAVCSEKK